ncbi:MULTISPECIES: fibronectin type III domain-containing protein [Paenibacillus]|uniref:fibronectin type III domain-containing protein n=1 Tax=Paenibacillus TaxID=44249 RepID=UPI0022B88879|nr:fibronectin type III domain-containing protein [Paenibacillus caseinilyticus]MCZ8518223.1 fibronectin type III domain-containing protein [Paenibacillus caseinilyticus]
MKKRIIGWVCGMTLLIPVSAQAAVTGTYEPPVAFGTKSMAVLDSVYGSQSVNESVYGAGVVSASVYGPAAVPLIKPVAEVPGKIQDADAERVLYLAEDSTLQIRSRSTGADTQIFKDASFSLSDMRLTPNGAVFSTRKYENSKIILNIYLWKDGGLTQLNAPGTQGYWVAVKGPHAIYTYNNADGSYGLAQYLNTVTGAAHSLPYDSPISADMTPDGKAVIAWGGGIDKVDPLTGEPSKIIGWEPGRGEMLAALSDGTVTLYQEESGGINKFDGAAITELSRAYTDSEESKGAITEKYLDYQVNNGWIAWGKLDDEGDRTGRVQDPAGTEYVIPGPWGDLVHLASDGEVYYHNETALYHYTVNSEPAAIDSDISGAQFFFRDGQLYKAMGGKLYQYVEQDGVDTAAPVWNEGTALSVGGVTYDSVSFSWQPAHDETGVTGYRIYRGSELIDTLAGGTYSYTASGLTPETAYQFSVAAEDAAGNLSTNNPQATVTTTAAVSVSSALAMQLKPGVLNVGSVAEVQIRADQAADLYGFLLSLKYDGSLLKLNGVYLNQEFGKEGTGAVLGKVISANAARISGALLGEVPGKSGSTGLVTLKFTVLKQGSGEIVLESGSRTADSQGRTAATTAPVVLRVSVNQADFDGDGQIGLSDLVLISQHHGTKQGQPGYDPRFDLDHNGQVDGKDVQQVANQVSSGVK